MIQYTSKLKYILRSIWYMSTGDSPPPPPTSFLPNPGCACRRRVSPGGQGRFNPPPQRVSSRSAGCGVKNHHINHKKYATNQSLRTSYAFSTQLVAETRHQSTRINDTKETRTKNRGRKRHSDKVHTNPRGGERRKERKKKKKRFTKKKKKGVARWKKNQVQAKSVQNQGRTSGKMLHDRLRRTVHAVQQQQQTGTCLNVLLVVCLIPYELSRSQHQCK